MSRFTCHFFLVSAAGMVAASAATPLPPWYDVADSSTTRQGYIFNSNSLTPAPTIQENSYGTAATTISLGPFASNWQSNAPGSIDLNGVDGDGAWDLGTSSTGLGSILTTLNFAPTVAAPGSHYVVEFFVYVVAYEDLQKLPQFNSGILTPVGLTEGVATPIAADVKGGIWMGKTWTGSFDNITSNSLTFGIKAPTNDVSTVDTYEVFTRYTLVPEPSSSVMLLSFVFAMAARRRRA